MIRLIALDVDGTLLDSRGQIRPRVEQAIRAAMTSGREVVLATGRRIQSVAPIAQRLGVTRLILVDGAVIYDLERAEALYEQTLRPSDLRRAVDLLRETPLPPILFESPAVRGRILAAPSEHDNPPTTSYLGWRPEVVRLPWADLPRIKRVVEVIAMGSPELVERAGALAAAAGPFGVVVWPASLAGYHHPTVTISPSGATKGSALAWLAVHLGIAPEETMSVGDFENDLSMILAAGIGVAMGNAVEAVRNAAHAIVADHDNDGVAEALETFVLGARG